MKQGFWTALAMLAWAAAAWVNAEQWAPLGSTRWLAALGAGAGVLAARRLDPLRLRLPSLWGLVGLAGLTVTGLAQLLLRTELPSALVGPELLIFSVTALSWTALWGLGALLIRTSARRLQLFVGLEAMVVCSGFVGVLAGHRQGYINRPYFLVDPLWSQGYDPLPFFLAIGAAIAMLGAVICASHSGRRSLLDLALVGLLIVVGFMVLPVQKLKDLPQLQQGGGEGESKPTPQPGKSTPQPSPGKGDEDKSQSFEDQSAHALNPPVAVVLFGDDYEPEDGAFYFRQTASSQYNGVRIVRSSEGGFDTDVADRFPVGNGEHRPEDAVRPSLSPLIADAFRPLETKVALMSQHTTPFGLANADLFQAEANPDPKRFQKAYSVHSQVLNVPLKELFQLEVGDSHWDKAAWQHYTAGPNDPRYAALVRKIVAAMPPDQRANKFFQAVYIKFWLDEHAIYSLTSKSANSVDPVGDYLFGDITGYCVYLSHAACYLWRAAGIPARIGGGYMAPASDKGKGSALLLRGRSAHSWPEVYLEGVGWLVLDISPHKSVVPAGAPPDSSLQQMMGDMARNRPAPDKPRQNVDLQAQLKKLLLALLRALPGLLAALALAAYGTRIYRRLAPRFAPESRLPVVALRSLLDQLAERGELRQTGQSRESFARQLHDRCASLAMLTRANLSAKLGKDYPQGRNHYLELLTHAQREFSAWPLPWYRRVLIFFDPISWWKVK